MANTNREKELKTNWPVEEGLTARTTKQTGKKYLHAENRSVVESKDLLGIGD